MKEIVSSALNTPYQKQANDVRKETVGQCERILDDNVSSGELSSLQPYSILNPGAADSRRKGGRGRSSIQKLRTEVHHNVQCSTRPVMWP